MKNRILGLTAVVFALALAACSSGSPGLDSAQVIDGNREPATLSGNIQKALPDGSPTQEWLDAQWEAWLNDPGEPGVDYDPNLINVTYSAAALNYRSASSTRPESGLAAADQPLSVLRKNPGYEAVTDAIAAEYPVSIYRQVYYGEVNFATFRVDETEDPAAVLRRIRSEFGEYIEHAAYSMLFHKAFSPVDPFYVTSTSTTGRLWFLHKMNCAEAWDYTKGDPSVWVADVDTGVYMDHQEFTGRVIDPAELLPSMPPGTVFDLANNDNTMEDSEGHGTFIAGILAAKGNDTTPLVGVAFQSRIVPVKISNGGSTPDSNIIAGSLLGFEAGAKSVNLSWGGYHHNPNMQGMVNTIYNGGGLLFGAAGNDNTSDFHYPSDYAKAVSVGSTNKNDGRTSFSNYSTAVDIAAPGNSLTSTGQHDTDDYHEGYVGTSFSCPMVAAAATLLWTFKPELTNDEVRFLLESTGAVTTGFQDTSPPVLRLDIGAALDEIDAIRVAAPKPAQMIQQGTITLTPTIVGEPDVVEAYFDGVLVETLSGAPYDFEIDTTHVSFGGVKAEFIARKGGEQASASVDLVVDNTTGSFPIVEGFESPVRHFVDVDLKGYHVDVLKDAKSIPGPGANWAEDDVASQGAAKWHVTLSNPFDGSVSMTLGTGQNSYDAYELDALISRRVKLTGISDATAVFYHRYNIEDGGQAYDKAWVYVTPDYGATMLPAELKTGGEAWFSGYQNAWVRAEIDLSSFGGLVHVILLFESDPLGSGEESGAAGWWVDNITLSTNYNEDVPAISGVSVPPYSYYGEVPGAPELGITIDQTENVDRVRYILDVVPIGVINGDDKIVDADAEPFGGVVTGLPGMPNQLANLRIQYFDTDNNTGPELVLPVYIFNLLGDVNADNTVNQADLDAYGGMIGLTSALPGYNPLFDSNLDGLITESDASAVGYFWGSSI